jgi:hypothetical protein
MNWVPIVPLERALRNSVPSSERVEEIDLRALHGLARQLGSMAHSTVIQIATQGSGDRRCDAYDPCHRVADLVGYPDTTTAINGNRIRGG